MSLTVFTDGPTGKTAYSLDYWPNVSDEHSHPELESSDYATILLFGSQLVDGTECTCTGGFPGVTGRCRVYWDAGTASWRLLSGGSSGGSTGRQIGGGNANTRFATTLGGGNANTKF